MDKYITLREYAEKNNVSVSQAYSQGIELGAIKTINEGEQSNIYINSDIKINK